MYSPHIPRQHGVALILVLGALAILTILVVAFIATVQSEYSSARSYANTTSTKLLAETSINTVIAQISRGTKSVDGSGSRVTWASQPGMIRTFSDTGAPAQAFKLFSAPEMISSGPYNPATDLPPSNWGTLTNTFVDLNEPIGESYPILSGQGLQNQGATKIYDQDGNGNPDVEGFSVENAPGASSTNPVPMPVRWLYVLADGTIVPATGTGATAAVPGANATTRKILGRIAFWTDDESTKINLNTAAEGNFWNVPVADGRGERVFAINSPVRGEYQRFPGHPASVSISAAFQDYFSAANGVSLNPGNAADLQKLQQIFSLTPRYGWGGSQAGSRAFSLTPGGGASPAYVQYRNEDFRSSNPPPPVPTLTLPGRRLYATSDEALLTPTRNVENAPLQPDAIRRSQFFLTTSSKAPETTLFNTPRVSIWPITWPTNANLTNSATPITQNTYYTNTTPPQLDATERLLAFAGTLGNRAYYFQRQNSQSSTVDYAQIGRNRDLYAYLQRLTGLQIPGFSGSFLTKYGADRDQILTMIFDYIRSGPNLNNTVTTASSGSGGIDNYLYSPRNVRANFSTRPPQDAGGSVVPIQIGSTRGMGRFVTINEAALVFYAADRRRPDPAGNQFFINRSTGCQTTRLGMYLVLNVCNTMTGYITNRAYFIARVSGQPFRINGSATTFPTSQGSESLMNVAMSSGGYMSDSNEGFMGSLWTLGRPTSSSNAAKSLTQGPYHQNRYPFYATPVAVSPDATTFSFQGSEVQLEIYPVNLGSSDRVRQAAPVQTITLDFRLLDGTYPMPVAPYYCQTTGTNAPPQAILLSSVPPAQQSSVPAQERYDATRYYFSNSQNSSFNHSIAGSGGNVSLWPLESPILNAPLLDPTFTAWDMRNLQARAQVTCRGGDHFDGTNTPQAGPSGYFTPLIAGPYNGNNPWTADTVISLKLNPAPPVSGDLRLLAGRLNVPASWFVPHYLINNLRGNAASQWNMAHSLALGVNGMRMTALRLEAPMGALQMDYKGFGAMAWSGANTRNINQVANPGSFAGMTSAPVPEVTGDFNNSIGNQVDGAVVPKPDDSTGSIVVDPANANTSLTPYFGGYAGVAAGQDYFSPSRQLSGPVLFGALPTGVQSGVAWRTLAFNPNPMQGSTHLGLQTPPDHLLLDLFWMPVVEPYAISEPLATSGKINMNYQIVPFTYIKRATGMHAVLKSAKVTAIPSAVSNTYKSNDTQSGAGNFSPGVNNPGAFRFPINVTETLTQFEDRFASNDIFRSASEICTVFLVPRSDPVVTSPIGISLPATAAATRNWWNAGQTSTRLTGANARQQPYSNIYSLLTTRSNTFQVHYRVQVLVKGSGSAPEVFGDTGDVAVAEHRGSAILERYVDPGSTSLPDFATDPAATLDDHYRFRIIETKAFRP